MQRHRAVEDERVAELIALCERVGFKVYDGVFVFKDGTRGPFALVPRNSLPLMAAALKARKDEEDEKR